MTKTLLFFLLTLVVDDIDLLASTLGREGDTGGLPLSKFTGGGSMVENVEAATRCGKKIILGLLTWAVLHLTAITTHLSSAAHMIEHRIRDLNFQRKKTQHDEVSYA